MSDENRSLNSEGSALFDPEKQANFRKKLQQRRQKNSANIQISKFKQLIQKKDSGGQIALSNEKLQLLPANLLQDPDEAIIYIYFCVRYLDEHMYKVILSRTQNLSQASPEIQSMFKETRSFYKLSQPESFDRFKLNQVAFEISLEKDYMDIAFYFIENGLVHITWDMIRKMLESRQEYLVKQCIKYGCKFDQGSAQVKKIIFAGRTAQPIEDRNIKLVDFIQIMLELSWKSREIIFVLTNYQKKGKLAAIDLRELFLLFAMKRKLKLMSHLINSEDFQMDFTEDNFIDVIENDVYDMGVLLYREFFLLITGQQDKITTLLVNSFSKANGQIEAKAFLLRRFIQHMSFAQAQTFLENIEERIYDQSRSNILVHTLNVVKSACLLIELLSKVRAKFSFVSRRVIEIRKHIAHMAVEYMADVNTEEEMRFLLLEKDLDNRDALNLIYDNKLTELLNNPFAQNIVLQIWGSPYNNSQSVASVSSNHNLLWNYNHCRYDWEQQLRFYRKKDLNQVGCHGFQFQVWRYSGQSRYFIQALCTWAFVLIVHIQLTYHLQFAVYIKKNAEPIQYALDVSENPENFPDLTANQIALQQAYAEQVKPELYAFEWSGMTFVLLFYMQWMYVFQLFYQGTYAGRLKRVMKYFQFENMLDTFILLIDMCYLIIILRDYRYGTFLSRPEPIQEAIMYFKNYVESPVQENLLLFIIGTLLWIKAIYQLKYIEFTGNTYMIISAFAGELGKFMAFFGSVVFMFAIVGIVLFRDDREFAGLYQAMYYLLSSPDDYFVFYIFPRDSQYYSLGRLVGYIYIYSYLIANLFLVKNLLIAQIGAVYQEVRKHGSNGSLYLLSTLSVREVSEADEKYSAVVSAPFPLSILNLVFGSAVLGAKSHALNRAVLHLYYVPVMLGSFAIFTVYQILILPLAYIKIAGHKWALVIRAPKGTGGATNLDRAGQAILFMLLGPLFVTLSFLADSFWFFVHMYKSDLDKTITKRVKSEEQTELPEIHRRTYKKMLSYFELQNDQLVMEVSVAKELREHLDVDEGLRCMIYGKPAKIPQSKINFYLAYAEAVEEELDSLEDPEAADPAAQDEENRIAKVEKTSDPDEFFKIERIVHEYSTIKQVLINNSFPVDIATLQSGGDYSVGHKNTKGWGMRVLFDKKIFLSLLTELEQMRKIYQVKKQFYLFNVPYFGKPSSMSDWHRKVEHRTTQTLKFLNLSRILKIIKYDPSLYMNMSKLNAISSHSPQNYSHPKAPQNQMSQNLLFRPPYQSKDSFVTDKSQRTTTMSAKESFLDQSRKGNQGFNLYQILSKYTKAGNFLQGMAELVRRVNHQTNEDKKSQKSATFHSSQQQLQQNQKSAHQNEAQQKKVEERYEKQARVNALSPTKTGVISSPDPRKQDQIQKIPSPQRPTSYEQNLMAFPKMPQNRQGRDKDEAEMVLSQSDEAEACIDDESDDAGHNFANVNFGAAGSRRVSSKVQKRSRKNVPN